jgi:hypothetical protein
MLTNNERRVLDRLKHSAVRIRTDWDEEPDIKATFLSLEKDGHIERNEESKLFGAWHITDSGKRRLLVDANNEKDKLMKKSKEKIPNESKNV